MHWHIKELAAISGVSVRTLHYYDEIGLLKPCFVNPQNGYRVYDEASLERMQEILFYRELDFSLKSIGAILDSPHYDKPKALAEQKRLLTIKKERLERLIAALEQAEKGEITMHVFDNKEYESARQQYENEAKQRWGDTAAYQESREKTATYSTEQMDAATAGLMAIFGALAACKDAGHAADSDAALAVVQQLQAYITTHFYTCTNEILAGLGQMYVGDERFRSNIDRYGDGTAAFAAQAICAYCAR